MILTGYRIYSLLIRIKAHMLILNLIKLMLVLFCPEGHCIKLDLPCHCQQSV